MAPTLKNTLTVTNSKATQSLHSTILSLQFCRFFNAIYKQWLCDLSNLATIFIYTVHFVFNSSK